jgi:hypothetical protein
MSSTLTIPADVAPDVRDFAALVEQALDGASDALRSAGLATAGLDRETGPTAAGYALPALRR